MKNTRFTEEQKAFALRQAESGVATEEITRKMGISEATFTAGRRSSAAWAWPVAVPTTHRYHREAESGGLFLREE